MFKTLLIILSASLLYSCKTETSKHLLPADWLSQEAVFLTYTGNPRDTATTNKVMSVCDQLIGQISPHLKMYLLVNAEWNTDSMMKVFSGKRFHTKNIELVPVYKLFDMGVVRDYGPIIVKDEDGNRKLLRFNWDYVGADFLNPDTAWQREKDKTRDRYFTRISRLLGMEVISNPLALEGGEIEVNGSGTAIIVDSFYRRRNPFFTDQSVDSLLHLSLGISKVIRLREGVAEDPAPWHSRISGNIYGTGVGGHVDEFARFVNPTTVLLAMPTSEEASNDPIKRINYERMMVNYQILSKAKDQDGKGFTIIKVPCPDVTPDNILIDTTDNSAPGRWIRADYPELKHGTTVGFLPAVSYLNYIILNNLVILPRYSKPGHPASGARKDEEVRKIFQLLFPEKTIIGMDPTGLNFVGGGFHCWTQQVPSK